MATRYRLTSDILPTHPERTRAILLPPRRPQLLRFDSARMRADFDRRPFLIPHALSEHPLFELPRLVDLASKLPVESVEYNAGSLDIDQDPTLTPRNGLSVEQTLRNIQHCGSWMVLKNVEQDERYRLLLDDCLDQIASVGAAPGMAARKAFIFVSSPGAVTPYHVDFEHNFLLQICGRKRMTVFDPHDRTLFSELDRERAVNGAPRNLRYRPEFAAKGLEFELRPGVGLHVPLTSPHWVEVDDAVSISFSITFQSTASAITIGAHELNAQLRRMGISPRDVGSSPLVDGMKYNASRIVRRLGRLRGLFERTT